MEPLLCDITGTLSEMILNVHLASEVAQFEVNRPASSGRLVGLLQVPERCRLRVAVFDKSLKECPAFLCENA
jgi:hypothetical protein